MLQLKNNTPFAATIALLPNEQGVDTLYIIVKASFNIGSKWTLLDEQAPPVEEDKYWTEPGESSLKSASDFHLGKPVTDIIMNGHACAPEGKQATQLDASISIGSIHKTVRVFGDREWQNGQVTAPIPFKTMPVVYEKAYGGVHKVEGQILSGDPRNPVGTGYAGKRKNGEMTGVALPNIEDPAQLINSINDQPAPAGFSYLAPTWQPRVNFAGTYDDVWETTQAPYLPSDFDKRFFNMAHPDLIYPGFLQGSEPVQIKNMHPGGDLQFNLPQIKMVTNIDVSNRIENPAFSMETLILEPNQLQLAMVWRAALSVDKEALKVKLVTINLSR